MFVGYWLGNAPTPPDHAVAEGNELAILVLDLFGGEVGPGGAGLSNRATLFAAAATAMRRILVDHARAKSTKKRGGPRGELGDRIPLDVIEAARTAEPDQILALDDAISRLEHVDERAATVVKLRFYGGLEQSAIGELLDVSERTVKRDWEFARAWLRQSFDETEAD